VGLCWRFSHSIQPKPHNIDLNKTLEIILWAKLIFEEVNEKLRWMKKSIIQVDLCVHVDALTIQVNLFHLKIP